MDAPPNSRDQMVAYFRALADVSRLKIIGHLARRPCSVEELAELLQLKPPTVSHHLHRLAEAGLVSSRGESYYSVYYLEEKALEQQARRLLSRQDFADMVDELDVDGYDRKVLADFSHRDGSLKTIPAQQKKLEAVLRHIVKAFAPGKRYSEKQVNKILLRFHTDTATLRRELVGFGLMQREGGGDDYWRTEDKT
jgi:DNA-binding HxlR family transcriptional regulator